MVFRYVTKKHTQESLYNIELCVMTMLNDAFYLIATIVIVCHYQSIILFCGDKHSHVTACHKQVRCLLADITAYYKQLNCTICQYVVSKEIYLYIIMVISLRSMSPAIHLAHDILYNYVMSTTTPFTSTHHSV